MTVKMEFNFPEDRETYETHYKAFDYYNALWDLNQLFRNWDKNGVTKTHEEIKKEFFKLLSEINFE